MAPLVENAIGRPAQFIVVAGQRGGDHRQFMRVGADGFEIRVHRQQHVGRSGEGGTEPFLHRLDAPALPQKTVPPPRSEIGQPQAIQLPQPLDLVPQFCFGACIQHVQFEAALSLGDLARAQFVEDGERRNFPHRGVGPRPVEMQFVLAVDLAQLIFGQAKIRQPVDEVRREHLGLAVERVTGEPDQLLLGKADRAGMIELGAQFALVDHFGEADGAAAVDDREGHVFVRIEFPDHLQHQQLVEIGIEQAAHDRVEPPAVIVGPRCDVRDCHGEEPYRVGAPATSARCGSSGLRFSARPPALARPIAASTSVQGGLSGANCRLSQDTSSATCRSLKLSLKPGM